VVRCAIALAIGSRNASEKFPKGEYFIFDVQTHFTDGVAIGFRKAEFIRNMGFNLKDNSFLRSAVKLKQWGSGGEAPKS